MNAISVDGAFAGPHSSVRVIDRRICLLCGSTARPLYGGLRDRLYHAPGEWSLVRCAEPTCGLVWLQPAPDERDIGLVYERYFTHAADAPAWRSTHPVYRTWVRLGGAYRAAISKSTAGQLRRRAELGYLDQVSPGHLLDVGCGDGSWLAKMRDAGWRVEGQEVDANAASLARERHGLTVHEGELRSLALPAASFDAVNLSHVIEHVYAPLELLAECGRILKPGGRLVALTPNIESYGHREYRSNWVALDPPRHLFLFSPTTLATAADRAGLRGVRVWTNQVRAQFIATASEDIRRTGRHDLHKTYTLPQLASAVVYEQRAWAAYGGDSSSGDELVLEATA